MPIVDFNVKFLPNRIVHTLSNDTIATEFLLIQLTINDLGNDEKITTKIASIMKRYQFYSPKQNPTFNTLLYFENENDWNSLEETVRELPLHRSIIVGQSNLEAVIEYYIFRNYRNYGDLAENQSSARIFDQ